MARPYRGETIGRVFVRLGLDIFFDVTADEALPQNLVEGRLDVLVALEIVVLLVDNGDLAVLGVVDTIVDDVVGLAEIIGLEILEIANLEALFLDLFVEIFEFLVDVVVEVTIEIVVEAHQLLVELVVVWNLRFRCRLVALASRHTRPRPPRTEPVAHQLG
ncbi:hypothetical protein [Acidimicrobium ferrooxidans]|uniref:hypothetical protein n=1 Tax=Acidimicrobium ferrooxidans TaxID=53635 RepID=UPI00019DE213|nr:hypothetical protein [Acidimicrobium ferrooxidans]